MNDYICPISFINEEQAKTTDLNELFIAGYRDKICNDFGHSMLLDEFKKSFDFEHLSPDDGAWLNDIHRYEYEAFNDAIISYIVNNVTDLTINTMILAMQTLLLPNNLIDLNIDQIVNELNIRGTITDAVAELYGEGFIRGEHAAQTFLSVDMRMNSLYSIIVTKVFNAYIDAFVAVTVKCSGIEMLFETLYAVTYNSNEYPKDQSYSNMYVFCTSILREAMDNQTMQFRVGLKNIASTVAAMVSKAPLYAQQASNPNYCTANDNYPVLEDLNNMESGANNIEEE